MKTFLIPEARVHLVHSGANAIAEGYEDSDEDKSIHLSAGYARANANAKRKRRSPAAKKSPRANESKSSSPVRGRKPQHKQWILVDERGTPAGAGRARAIDARTPAIAAAKAFRSFMRTPVGQKALDLHVAAGGTRFNFTVDVHLARASTLRRYIAYVERIARPNAHEREKGITTTVRVAYVPLDQRDSIARAHIDASMSKAR